MTKYNEIFYAYDIITPNIVQSVTEARIVQPGVESAYISDNRHQATEYMLKGLTPDIARMLKVGDGYLVMEIEAIDHTKPTANGRLYPKTVFYEGMMQYTFQNQMSNGGVSGKELALIHSDVCSKVC